MDDTKQSIRGTSQEKCSKDLGERYGVVKRYSPDHRNKYMCCCLALKALKVRSPQVVATGF